MGFAARIKTPATYGDYLAWNDGQRWEIIEGQPHCMTPAPSPRHQTVLLNLAAQFREKLASGPCRVFIAPFDVRLPEPGQTENEASTVVQPDMAVVCDRSRLDDRGLVGPPELIVEVLSPATASRDLIVKRALYERHGVREYWTVHPVDLVVTIWSLGPDKAFAKPVYHGPDAPIASLALPGLIIDPALVFDLSE